jgi:hypothetical protein
MKRRHHLQNACWAMVVASVCAGCEQKAPATTTKHPSAAPTTRGQPVPIELTEAKLDRYIEYRQKLATIEAGLMKELGALEPLSDGGTKIAPEAAARRLRPRLEAERKAKLASGLSDAEIEAFDDLMNEVMPKRAMVKALDEDAAIAEMERMKAKMPKDEQARFQENLDAMKKRREQHQDLSAAREKYGDAIVDAALKREDALLKLWK